MGWEGLRGLAGGEEEEKEQVEASRHEEIVSNHLLRQPNLTGFRRTPPIKNPCPRKQLDKPRRAGNLSGFYTPLTSKLAPQTRAAIELESPCRSSNQASADRPKQ